MISLFPAPAPEYTRDPKLARAFVEGILESGADAERALDAIEHHCADRGFDSSVLVDALRSLTETKEEGAA